MERPNTLISAACSLQVPQPQVAHIIPEERNGPYQPDNLLPLCRNHPSLFAEGFIRLYPGPCFKSDENKLTKLIEKDQKFNDKRSMALLRIQVPELVKDVYRILQISLETFKRTPTAELLRSIIEYQNHHLNNTCHRGCRSSKRFPYFC
jgi:hypothetical protein